jgi:hypothetical protein
MISRLKNNIKRHLTNLPGWRTDRKIVVFESDDWGSIRMPSKNILDELEKIGVQTKSCHYIQNDALASEKDLDQLFNVLLTVKDVNGSYPVLTANVILANPDFYKIKLSGFKKYFYEPFTETLKRYPEHKNSFEIWKDGIHQGIFYPQFHGREHLQVNRWMKYLKDPNSETRKAFDLELFGISTSASQEKRRSYMAAFDWDDSNEREFINKSIKEGLKLFNETFNYSSLSAIAPNYTWDDGIEKVFFENGVKYLQGGKVQRIPNGKDSRNSVVKHSIGNVNRVGQYHLIRNCVFEPSSDSGLDWVNRCLTDIGTAFMWGKPAIIETHRVNYIGFINKNNRDTNLVLLNSLLKQIVQKWPETEFMTSDQLGKLIENDKYL